MSEQEIRVSLDDLAHEMADRGTASRRLVLETLATAIRHIAPGIAAALTDWDGTEVSRLRAFGLAHRAVWHELDGEARANLAMHISSNVAYPLSAPLSREPSATRPARQFASSRAHRAPAA